VELTNEFRVGVPLEEAWGILTDVERIAPCMPGAQLQEIEGDEYRGVVKVKVGPITAQYKGAASFVEQEAPTRAVLRAEGRETRGQGGASATITALLEGDSDGTKVTVTTDLTVTGKVAQFGRGVLADVSSKLLGQFVDCLEATVLGGQAGAAAPEAPAAESADTEPETAAQVAPAAEETPAVRRIDSPEAKPVDLVSTAGCPVAKRIVPVAAGVALLWLIRLQFKRRER